MKEKRDISENRKNSKLPSFEWFYFDVHGTDGVDVVFSFHSLPFMSRFAVSILDIFVYKENRPYYHTFLIFPRKRLSIRRNGTEIQCADKSRFFLEFSNEKARLWARDEKVEVDVRFTNGHPQKEPLEFSLGEQPFYWKLYMPRAQAQGVLRIHEPKHIGDEEIPVNGRAYFDANNGNLNLKKTIRSWLWFKMYMNDELWIAGDVHPRQGAPHSVLVKVTPVTITHTTNVQIRLNAQQLRIGSPLGALHLQLVERNRLDELYFLVPVWPDWLAFPEKIREILAGLTLNRPALKPVQKWLTNGVYYRHRWLARTEDGRSVEIFGEEMILNA